MHSFLCVFLKNNLRRINCTVMEVKYCHPSSKTITLAAHLSSVVSLSLFSVRHSKQPVRFQLVFWLIPLRFCCVLARVSRAPRSIHLCFNLFHISTSERRRCNTNTCTSDNSKVNSSLHKIWAPSPGHTWFPRWRDHFYCRNQEVKLIALRLSSLHD